MKIIYSPQYDGEIFLGNQPECFSVLYAGNIQLLNQLGLRTGIHVEPASDMEREAAYQQAMTSPIKGTTFEKSFVTDPMGVAAKLLLWRDNLIMAGWNGKCDDKSLTKLQLLAETEKNFVDMPKGMADYWRTICECLQKKVVMRKAINEIQLDCPWSEIPALVQRCFTALNDYYGVKINKTIPDNLDVNLNISKIKVAHFDDILEAYEWIAQVETMPRNCAIINRDNVRLNHTLYTWNKPAVHASLSQSNPQLLQLFKLCPCVFARPLNLGNLIAYLRLPLNPIPSKLRYKLARLLLKNGGFGDIAKRDDGQDYNDWDEAIKTYEDEVATDTEKQEKFNERKLYIEPIRNKKYDMGIGKTDLLTYLESMQTWLNGLFALVMNPDDHKKEGKTTEQEENKNGDAETKIQKNILSEEDIPQLKELKDMFSTLIKVVKDMSGTVSYDDIEKIVSRIYRPISYTLNQPEKDSLNVISDIRSMAVPADTLVWLDCQAEEVERDLYDFLSTAERNYLQGRNVLIPDFTAHLKVRRNERNRLLNSVTGNVLLVQSSHDGTQRLSEHSLIAEVKRLCHDHYKEEDAQSIHPKKKADTEVKDIDIFEPKMYYNLPQNMSAFIGREESNSSLEKLIQRPFNYVMDYVAQLPMPEDEQVKSPYLTTGLVAHYFFQHVIEKGKAMKASDIYNDMRQIVNSQYDQLLQNAIKAKGLILLAEENATQLHNFKWQLKESMLRLIEIMEHLNLNPVGCEINYPTKKEVSDPDKEKETLKLDTIGEFGARIDFALTNDDGNYVIFDFKWSFSSRYEENLQKNASIQLELYKQAIKKYLNKEVAAVGYYMMPKQKLYTPDFDDWENAIVKVDAPAVTPSLFEQIQNSYKFRKEELEKGKIEEAELQNVTSCEYFDKTGSENLFPLELKDKSTDIKNSEYVFKPNKKRSYEDSKKEPYEIPTSHPVLKGRLK